MRYRPRKENTLQGCKVTLKPGEDVGRALRRLKRKLEESRIFEEIKKRQHYVKPSEQRRKAKAAGRARWLKNLQKRKDKLGY